MIYRCVWGGGRVEEEKTEQIKRFSGVCAGKQIAVLRASDAHSVRTTSIVGTAIYQTIYYYT